MGPDPLSFSVGYGFNAKNLHAVAMAEAKAAQMVTVISSQTRDGLRALVARAIRDGMAPATLAREIRKSVGMNARQAQAAANYRRRLVAQGLSAAKVDKAVERYVKKKIAERSKMIARTEIMQASNHGTLESWSAAQDDGWLPPNTQKEWIITPTEACDECKALSGERVPLKNNFSNGDSAPPAHPHCRCTIGTYLPPAKISTPPVVQAPPSPVAPIVKLVTETIINREIEAALTKTVASQPPVTERVGVPLKVSGMDKKFGFDNRFQYLEQVNLELWSPSERRAIAQYKAEKVVDARGGGWNAVANGVLRGNEFALNMAKKVDPRKLERFIKAIDSAVKKAHLADDVTLYRGGFAPKGIKAGDTFIDKGFLSTSFKENVALQFNRIERTKSPIWRIKVKGGTNAAIPQTAEGKYSQEYDVLFGRGSKLHVTSVGENYIDAWLEAT